MGKMVTISIPRECLEGIKEYLIEFKDYSEGSFMADCVSYVMEHIEDFEAENEIEDTERWVKEEGEEEETTESEEE